MKKFDIDHYIIFSLLVVLVIIGMVIFGGLYFRDKTNAATGTRDSINKMTFAHKYLYIDKAHVLHTKNGCKAVLKIEGGSQPVKPVRYYNIKLKELENVCSQCVTPEELETLNNLIGKSEQQLRDNTEKFIRRNNKTPIKFKDIDELYLELVEHDFNLCPIEEFRDSMKDLWYYSEVYLECINRNIPICSFEEFEKKIGVNPSKKNNK